MTAPAIVITGATGAIGAALASEYAAPGQVLILHGRDQSKLAAIALACTQRGARVILGGGDVRDHATFSAWLQQICADEDVGLVFANAGVNIHAEANSVLESWQAVEALIDINVRAVFATVHAVVPAMRRRGGGQIVLMSSLAAYFGLPQTPAYSASKAAIKAYGEAMRAVLADDQIGVTVVMPGYVDSQMCQDMPGPKPFLWTAEKAARVIRRAATRNVPRVSFPFPLNFACWGLAALRPSIAAWLLKKIDYAG